MGRKKRTKIEEAPSEPTPAMIAPDLPPPPVFAPPPAIPPQPPIDPRVDVKENSMVQIKSASIKKVPNVELDEADLGTKPSSMYGLHSHAGDLVEDDIYVSDGSIESDSDEEERNTEEGGEKEKTKKKETPLELVLTTSKMGLMRRGGISSLLGQPTNRTWVRSEQADAEGDAAKNETGDTGTIQEEEKEITDPVLLLQIKQRKIEQAKQNARILEASENAGRDPCLFSKRTAFDIRMDQIEDKPWEKSGQGGADITDYMNYGLTEEDWMEYAERQLAVRQELTDAAKQKRLPDPGIVPVVPRAPTKQGERVAVRVKKDEAIEDDAVTGTGGDLDDEHGVEMVVPFKAEEALDEKQSNKDEGEETAAIDAPGAKTETPSEDVSAGKVDKIIGGAWGAGAKEDSMLIRLIQEQSGQPTPMMMGAPGMVMNVQHPNMMPPPNMMAPPPPPPPPKIMQPHDQNKGLGDEQRRRDTHPERHPDDVQWRRDINNQREPPSHSNHHNGRERYDGDRGHSDSNWNHQHLPPNFRQQQQFQQRRGPPHGGDYPGGPPPHMARPHMGRGGWGGRGGGPPPQWGDNRKRPRDFDPRSDPRQGRW